MGARHHVGPEAGQASSVPDPAARRRALDRRRFLLGALAVVGGACGRTGSDAPAATAPPTSRAPTSRAPTVPPTTVPPTTGVEPLEAEPVAVTDGFFGAGVASGDPGADGFVLWTRGFGDGLAPIVPLVWEVAADPAFADLVATGRIDAGADAGHAVHVTVGGLHPSSRYHYRFRAGERISPAGRSRTLPAAGHRPEVFRVAVSSCQLYETGHYAAHRHLADEDVDLVLWLGDFVYEGSGTALAGRAHRGGEARDLAGYRDRYAQYRSDPALQAAQAAHPWVVVWDDHEVVNDYAGLTVSGTQPAGFADRRAAAYRAWWENQPVRLPPPAGGALPIHRRFDVGSLARLLVLDTRQHRDPQPCGGQEVLSGFPLTPQCPETEGTSMLGAEQRGWLLDELAANDGLWSLIGQQVLFGGLDAGLGARHVLPDTWDGYAGERRLVGEALAGAPAPVVFTGDLHAGMALDVRPDPYDRSGPVVAAELMAPAISSAFPARAARLAPLAAGLNAHIAHFDPANGYLVATITPDRLTAEYRTVADVTDPDSTIATTARLTVDRDRRGLAR
jgi:alkaline phosphatase D